jgi:hypothetical protein
MDIPLLIMHNPPKELTGNNMQIQRPKRISSESVAEESQEAVDFIGGNVNNFMEQTYTAIMGQLGVNDNLNMEFKTVDVIVNASGIPVPSVSFKSNLTGKVVGVISTRIFLARPTSQPYIEFSENTGIVNISYVSGLVPNTKYQMILLSIGA